MTIQKKLHVLIIPSWYPKFKGDIGGSFFREQAEALVDFGHKVGVVFPQRKSIKSLYKGKKGIEISNERGAETYRYHYNNLTPRLGFLMQKKWVDTGGKLFKLYIQKHGKPDLIHAHSIFSGGFLAHEISEKYTIPFLLTEHSTAFSRGLISKKRIFAAKKIVKNASDCLAVSNEFCHLLNEVFETNRWNYVPNIVNKRFLESDISKCERKPLKHFRFINVCFLEPKKKVDILLKAFAIFLKVMPDAELEIGGEGPQKEVLINLVDELGIKSQVSFLGRLNRDEVLEKVSAADVFVLSSEYETFGVVIIEALALGKPVVATKCGGPESIITPDVGLLVEKNSESKLAEAMLNIYRNKHLYKNQDIRKHCSLNFSEHSVASQLTGKYTKIIQNYER